MNSPTAMRVGFATCAIFVTAIYCFYRPYAWPTGMEALGCLTAVVILVVSGVLVYLLNNKPIVAKHHKNIRIGLRIGLLWTVEISINNIAHPPLPYRDIIDDTFWAIIALLILIVATAEAFKKNNFVAGLLSGCWTGYASGLVACFTALVLVVFAMPLVLTDPLNIKEWADLHTTVRYPSMAVYFAYQTFTGAMLHLAVLGGLMGALLGGLGGVIGKGLRYVTTHGRQQTVK